MMNIFIMILLAVFMVGYYVISSPSNRLQYQETDTAVQMSDMHTIAECTRTAHNAQINFESFDDICVEQAGIKSETICLNASQKIVPCEVQNKRKPEYSFIITSTTPLNTDMYNDMMVILEKYYADAGTFGILQNASIVSGGTVNKRSIPKAVMDKLKLENGQLVYMTQYEIPDKDKEFNPTIAQDITCPAGTAKTYRFGRWQCISVNTKTDCKGDMVWNTELDKCVVDESRKPLCAQSQTAVIVDDVWECIDPFSDKTCPSNMIARLNYNTLEWECVTDPNNVPSDNKKCGTFMQNVVYGKPGLTLHVAATSCTDCEKAVVNEDTCEMFCVPDTDKINDLKCYPGIVEECSGPTRAFYFGFPSVNYAKNINELKNKVIPIDSQHSQNRKFNCLDCGDGVIDTDKSVSPYTAICK